MKQTEKDRVLKHSKIGKYSFGVNQNTVKYSGEIFRRHMHKGSVLEMGPAEGVMTDLLYPYFEDYTVVDGADFFIEAIKKRYPEIKGHAQLFEDFSPARKYDNIVLGHVLEHVENPAGILKRCCSWLTEGGYVLAAVPNANSIHRQAAVLMGLLETKYQLNETDIRNGHRRVYDMQSFRQDFADAGLKVVKSGGYWLKPVSNAQIDAEWTQDMIEAFMRLGEEHPEIAGEIYIIAAKELPGN